MGRIGVISDIHGNLQALNTILAYFDAQHCDEIIHTGDVVDIGPNSRECLDVLLARNDVTLLIGNHDRDFALDNAVMWHLSNVPAEHKQYVFSTLTEAHRKAVSKFPLCVTRVLAGDTVAFCHYAYPPNIDWKTDEFRFCGLERFPTAEAFDEMFGNLCADAVFFGHKHEPCDIKGKRLYVDVGSVGCHPQSVARGIIIDYDDTSWKYTRVEVPYDMEQTRQSLISIPSGEHLYNFYFLRLNATTVEYTNNGVAVKKHTIEKD